MSTSEHIHQMEVLREEVRTHPSTQPHVPCVWFVYEHARVMCFPSCRCNDLLVRTVWSTKANDACACVCVCACVRVCCACQAWCLSSCPCAFLCTHTIVCEVCVSGIRNGACACVNCTCVWCLCIVGVCACVLVVCIMCACLRVCSYVYFGCVRARVLVVYVLCVRACVRVCVL